MTEAEWLACSDVYDMVEQVESSASVRKVRLLGCACVRRAWEWGLNEPAPEAVRVAEAFVDGGAKRKDMNRAAGEMNELWREHDEPYRPYPRTCAWTESLTSSRNARAWLDEMGAYTSDLYIGEDAEWLKTAGFVRDIFGNPFRPVAFAPEWHTDTALALAAQMYESREFSAMPILADALQDAGCDNDDILSHCRGDGPHVRGCWVVDLVLGKE